jgi:hypothetical protein
MCRPEDHQQEDQEAPEDHQREDQEAPEDRPDTPQRHHLGHHQCRNLFQQDQAMLA